MKRNTTAPRPCLRVLCGICALLAVLALACDEALAAAGRVGTASVSTASQVGPVVTASACADRVPLRQSRLHRTDVAFCLAAPLLYGGRGALLTVLAPSAASVIRRPGQTEAWRDVLVLVGSATRTSALVRLMANIPRRPTLQLQHDVQLTASRPDRGFGAVFGVHYAF